MKYAALFLFAIMALVVLSGTAGLLASGEQSVRHAGRVQHDFPDRPRDIGCEPFSSITDCPKCGTLALHHIKDMLVHSCRRECIDCHYVWRQI